MQESLLLTSLRSFLKAFFTILGICLAFVPLIALVGLFERVEKEPESNYSITYLPNAEGDRTIVSSSAPVILSIPIQGVIGLDDLTMQKVREMLVESQEDTLAENRVKGIFLEISSPGGTVIDADGIYRALKEYKEQYKVPVYAYVDGLCASGGMYIACAADKIYSSKASLIGSVGVLIPSLLNVSKLINAIGVESLTLYAGTGKDELNPLRPWKPGEQDALQAIINNYYEQFVNIVTSNRPTLDKEKLEKVYGAHVFPALEAQDYGYIDESALSRRDALNLLLKELGLENQEYQVVQLESKSWFQSLFSTESPLWTGRVKHQLQLTPELDARLMNKPLYLYQPGM